jgi:exopolysaccharide production protein ExoQ
MMTGSAMPAYGFVACWISFLPFHARSSVSALVANPTIWIYPALALLSTFWSEALAHTLRTAVELVVTVGFAVISARHLSARHLVSAVLCGLSVIAVVSLSVRGFVTDPLTGAVDFVGPFVSKNYLAFFIALLWVTSLAVLLDHRQPPGFRLLSVVCFIISGPLLILARSATSDLTAVGSIIVFLANLGFSRLAITQRARGVFAMMVILLPAVVLLLLLGSTLQADVLTLLGKDATLTGRTELWARALQLIPEHPLLGQGYTAFWRDDYVESEALWARFQVRGGFHFHNTVIETAIETGYIGAAVLVSFVLGTLIRSLSWSWSTGSVPASYFATVMFLLIVRSLVEVDLLYPFSAGTFYCVISAYYGFGQRRGTHNLAFTTSLRSDQALSDG